MIVSDATEAFVAYIKSTRSPKTSRTYGTGLNRWQEYLWEAGQDPAAASLCDLTPAMFIGFLDWLATASELKKSTREVYAVSVHMFMSWAIVREYLELPHRVLENYRMVQRDMGALREQKMPRTPAPGDVDLMCRAARILKQFSPQYERDIAIVEFLASTGCRVGEAVGMRIGHMNMTERTAMVTGKGRKERIVFFGSEAKAALERYWHKRGSIKSDDPVFSRHDRRLGRGAIAPIGTESVEAAMRQIAKLAGLPKFTPHVFRHGFATKMLSATGNLAAVQDMLGHSSPTSTRVYAKTRRSDLARLHKEVFD